jgi:hypothetical protein
MLPNHLLFALLCVVLAGQLPTFEDFRRVDRERRHSGRLLSAELIELSRVDRQLIGTTAAENPDDVELLLGAAELSGDWTRALEANGTNNVVALRYTLSLLAGGEFDKADAWLERCRKNDAANVVPLMGTLWLLRKQGNALDAFQPPAETILFDDYQPQAIRARVRLLEKAGYSPYAARRISHARESFAVTMAQDLTRENAEGDVQPFLLRAAQAMQRQPTFLLQELVGQSLEGTMLMRRSDARADPQHDQRIEQLQDRRLEIQDLVSAIERAIIDLATESELVTYYDEILTLGEETALKRLARAVRQHPAGP